MYKLNYVLPMCLAEENFIGVKKKVDAQIYGFEKNNMDVKIVDVSIKNNSFKNKVIRKLPFTSIYGEWEVLKKIEPCECIYIRYIGSDYGFLKNLKSIKSRNKNTKIIIEIPTYPYEEEISKNLLNIPNRLKDRLNRKKLYKYVDRIVTYSDDEYIFKIKTINISNGVDISSVKRKQAIKNEGINVIAVASFSSWHGYDRFIKGLGEYYKNGGTEVINLHLVGDGDEIENYKKLIEEYDLNERVILYGRKSGIELDEIYDKCDIALDAMGRHRSGIFYNSSLKGKEYMAKGMPIVSGVKTELDKYKDFKYYKRVSADESNIDIKDIINFHENIYKNNDRELIIKEIRDLCTELFDINKCLKPIIDYVINDGRN